MAYVDYERVCGTEVWEKHLSICHGIVEFGRNALFNDVVRPNAGVRDILRILYSACSFGCIFIINKPAGWFTCCGSIFVAIMRLWMPNVIILMYVLCYSIYGFYKSYMCDRSPVVGITE